MDIITPNHQKKFVIDATMLTSIQKCGRYADIKFNHQMQSLKGKSNSLEIGSIIHKFCEVYYKSQMRGIKKTEAFGFGITAAELYIQGCPDCTKFISTSEQKKPKCNHEINEYPGLSNTPSESDGYITGWKFALQTCEEYHEFYRASDHWLTIDTETVRSKVLYEDEDVVILWKAKLDWIVDTNTGIFPCDHKTMKQNRDSLSINNQFMGQCRMMETRNVFINKIGLQKTLKPIDKFKRESVSYSASRLMEWQSTVLPYWVKQWIAWSEAEYYPPNFSSCESKFGKCDFYEVCESDTEMRNEVLRLNFYRGDEWNPTNNTED